MRYASEQKRLKEIIKGKKTRQFFENYVNPLCMWDSSPRYIKHPKDIRRLDRFICAISRFGSKINISELERYLIEDLAWSKKNANWVLQRIETGLEILKASKNFTS
ncbi:hypothetical protein H6F96_31290 [Microcoleus sp. FACHB-53]|nr:hypothetical protein [Microcoleus sp. FACHB-53]